MECNGIRSAGTVFMNEKYKRNRPFLGSLLLCMLAILSGCDSGRKGASSIQPTESEVIAAWVTLGGQPCLTQVANTANRMDAKVQELCENPSMETWLQAQEAWRAAYLSWRQAEPFLFGPAGTMNRYIGTWPVNGVVLDAAVGSKELDHMLNNTDVRGYAAVEHMLFAPVDAAAATTEERCVHLLSLSEEISRLSADTLHQWKNEIAPAFIAAGNGAPYLVPADALSVAFRELLNVTERMQRNRIGEPSGYFQGSARPEYLEAWLSQAAQDGFRASQEGIRRALSSGGNYSFIMLIATKDGLVEHRAPQLAADLVKQLDQIDKAIADLGGDDVRLEAELKHNPSKLKRLYKHYQKLQDQLVEAALVLELDIHQGA